LTVTVWQRMLQDTGTNQQTADKAKETVMLYTFLVSWHTLSYVMFVRGEVLE